MRKLLRITIREWFWVVLAIALAFAWGRREYLHLQAIERFARDREALSKEITDREFGLSAMHEQVQRSKEARLTSLSEVDAREGILRHEVQAVKNRLIEHKLECEMRKSELIYAAKKMLTKEQFSDFEQARQKYHTLPEDQRKLPY